MAETLNIKPVIYTDFVSEEPLDVIRANECEYNVQGLVTKRFRAFWNEIERLRVIEDRVEKREQALRFYAEKQHWGDFSTDDPVVDSDLGEIARKALEDSQ